MKLKSVHVLALLLLFQVTFHLLSLGSLFFNDEGTFLSSGWLMTRGKVPYKDFFLSYYPLGIPLIAASAFSILGPELYSAKLFLAASVLLTTVLLFFITRRIYGEGEALIAAAVFVILAPAYGSLLFLAEPFMAPLVLVLFYSLYSYDREGSQKWLFLSGVLCSLLVLMKPTGALFLASSIAYLAVKQFLTEANAEKSRVSFVLREVAVLLAGFILPLSAFLAYIVASGSFSDAYNQLVVFYGVTVSSELHINFYGPLIYSLIFLAPTVLFPVVLKELRSGDKKNLILFLLALVPFTLLFRFSYFRLLYALPLASIIVGIMSKPHLKHRAIRIISIAGILVFASTLAITFAVAYKGPDPAVGRVASFSSPQNTVIAVPFGPSLYFLAKREPGYRYLGLGPWGQLPDTEITAIRDIEERKPAVILYSKYKQWGKKFGEYEPLLDKYIWEHYEIAEETNASYLLVPKNSGSIKSS
jgi:4-amino-4-deoxy-L-arabinose transferase-like glycosyltransferase